MNREFWKKVLDESNLLIIIPAIVIVASLVWFLVFGLSNPGSSSVHSHSSIVNMQYSYENAYLSEFDTYGSSKDNPYFVLDPYKIAPLSGLLMFEVDVNTEFKVVIKGKTLDGDIEYKTKSLLAHNIPIYGLYPGIVNTVELYENDGVGNYTLISTISVETDPLPDEIKLPSLINTTYDYFQNDLMITMSSTHNYPVGYDYLGDVRWYLSEEFSWSPELLQNGHLLLGHRDLMYPYYSTELLEIDYLGKAYVQYDIPGGYHHDFTELSSGNLLVATNGSDGLLEDTLIELDRTTGEVVKTISIADYIDPLDGASKMWKPSDWFHLNSIEYHLLSDSIILSGSYQDIVISINYTTGELNWVLGDPTDWETGFVDQYFFTPVGDNFEWQYAQNGVKVLENGDIFLFDNGINKSKNRDNDIDRFLTYSRGVMFRLDTDLMTIEQIFEYGKDLGTDFYSSYNSNVEYYSDGNYLIHSGGHGMISGALMELPIYFENSNSAIDLLSITVELVDDVEVYKMEIEDNIYQVNRISLYENAVNLKLGKAKSLGAQTKTPEYESAIYQKFNIFDTVPIKHEIHLYKEFDRFVIEGTFNKDSSIYLVLENSSGVNQYYIPAKASSYEIICNDECVEGLVGITYYVNEEGMFGKYNVYLIIDGKKYNTYKTVTFE